MGAEMGEFQKEVAALLPWRKGHFKFESGHHGDTWLNLELLCLRPEPVEQLATVLADCLSERRAEIVCGPLIEGAFRRADGRSTPAPAIHLRRAIRSKSERCSGHYRLPGKQRDLVSGKRVIIVNDVIGAGSALLGTLKDLYECGADPVAIGALASRGPAAVVLARENGLALETLAAFPGDMWKPSECPLCAAGMPLSDESSPAAP
jgi:orotate phosphoribosyltransferase